MSGPPLWRTAQTCRTNDPGAPNQMQTTPQPVMPDIRPTKRTHDPVRVLLVLSTIGLALVLVVTLLGVGRPSSPTPMVAGASAAPSASQPTTKADDRRRRRLQSGHHDHRHRRRPGLPRDGRRLEADDHRHQRDRDPQGRRRRDGGGPRGRRSTSACASRRDSAGTYTVTAIVVPTPVTGGTVTAVDADSIDLKRRADETESVRITSATTYTVGKETGTKADVVVGARVAIEGTVDGGDLHRRRRPCPPRAGVRRRSRPRPTSTITLSKRNGTTVTVHVDGDTIYRVRGNGTATATVADITVGHRVNARGTLRADGSHRRRCGSTPARRRTRPSRPRPPAADRDRTAHEQVAYCGHAQRTRPAASSRGSSSSTTTRTCSSCSPTSCAPTATRSRPRATATRRSGGCARPGRTCSSST